MKDINSMGSITEMVKLNVHSKKQLGKRLLKLGSM